MLIINSIEKQHGKYGKKYFFHTEHDVQEMSVATKSWMKDIFKILLGLGWVLWHINRYKLFNAKSYFYRYIKYMTSKAILKMHFQTSLSSFFCTQLNGYNYCYITVTLWHQSFIWLYLNGYTCIIYYFCLHTVKWFQVLLCISNNSIKHQSFIYTHLNDLTVLFQTIQFGMSFVCTLFKCQKFLFDPIKCYTQG